MKEYTVSEIREKLGSDMKWAVRGLEVLFDHQTPREQAGEHTGELNGVGFSKFDAEILSSFAKRLYRGWHLSDRQMAVLYRRMPKYAGQLHRVAYGG